MDMNAYGVRVLNPGSISIPKDGSRSYMLIDNGKAQMKNVD